jgi:hypothetical protein
MGMSDAGHMHELYGKENDVGIMFAGFQAEMLKYGASLKTLMRKRGWIKIPPYYVPNGLPTQ